MLDNEDKKYIFNNMPYVEIDFDNPVPRQYFPPSNKILKEKIQKSPKYHKRDDLKRKPGCWHRLYRAAMHAIPMGGCIKVHLGRHKGDAAHNRKWCDSHQNVIVAAVDAGLFKLVKSTRANPANFQPHSSRLIPVPEMFGVKEPTKVGVKEKDIILPTAKPFVVPTDLIRMKQRVKVPYITKSGQKRTKTVKQQLVFDESLIAAADGYKILKDYNTNLINNIRWSYIKETTSSRLAAQTYVFASFIDNFKLGGDFYATTFQSLNKNERKTIEWEWHDKVFAATEIDLKNCFVRLVYHLENIDYQGDAFNVFGPATTPAEREVFKKLLNIKIFEPNNGRAINAAWNAANPNNFGKDTKKRQKAKHLQEALQTSGLIFEDIIEPALSFHAPIAHRLGERDYGLKLLNKMAQIMFEILQFFTRVQIPFLPIHDGGVTIRPHQETLIKVFKEAYTKHVDFEPTFKFEF